MKLPTLVVYQDTEGSWRWTLKAGNGRIVADGSEGYETKRGALRAARRVGLFFRQYPVETFR